jgi:hypothetical protein
MFALMINPESNLPAVMNIKSRFYLELKQRGYEEVMTGGKKRIEEREKEIMEELYPHGDEMHFTDLTND